MIVKKLTLNNFRQYKGKQDIIFSSDRDRNVTVILGVNTSGKTTIIEAFKWCLYGVTTYTRKELANAIVLEELGISQNVDTYVEVILIHGNTEYTIRRTQTTKKGIDGSISNSNPELKVFYKDKNGELISFEDSEMQGVVNNILPEALADYFFFDGERIGDIGNRRDIKQAVQGLMGLDVVTEAKNRLDPDRKLSITSTFESELDTGSDKKNEELLKTISENQNKLERNNEILESKEIELEYYIDKKEKLSKEIIANENVKDKQIRREQLEKDLKKINSRIEDYKRRVKKLFNSSSMDFFALPLIDKALTSLEGTRDDLEGIVGMNAKSIDHIISRKICICGCNLEENEDAKKNILEEKKLLPPYHIGTIIRENKGQYKLMKDTGDRFKVNIRDDYIRYNESRKDRDNRLSELKTISESLKGNIDVIAIEKEREEAEETIFELENEKKKLFINKGKLENQIDTTKKKRDTLVKNSEKNMKILECLAYCNELYNWFDKSYREQEQIVKTDLEKNVNEIFSKIYHGKRYLKIDENYRVHLDTKLGDELITTDESKGLEAVKNFSFVSGLVKIAKEKVKEDSSDKIKTEEPYPLIMDAPFSNVDEIHIENISNVLPNVAEQVIWILMEKDWNYAKKSLSSKVGYVYRIDKKNEVHSVLKGREEYV